VAIASNNKVRIFPGTGTGSFGPALPDITTPVNGQAITTGYFSDDPYPDLAIVGSGTDNVRIIYGDGSGGQLGNATIAVGDSPVSIVAADFDEDGIEDFATANLNEIAYASKAAKPECTEFGAKKTRNLATPSRCPARGGCERVGWVVVL